MSEEPKQNLKISPVVLVIISFVLLAIVAMTTILLRNQNSTSTRNNDPDAVAIVEDDNYDDGITDIDPPKPLDDFTLTSTAGEKVKFSNYDDHWRIIYFGYTNCPDFCPSTLTDFKRVKDELGDQADRVTFMMISVDGERDTPAELATYLGKFDSDFVGLTGTKEEVIPATKTFGVFFEKHDNTDTEHYAVDHTVSIFVVNPTGEMVALYAYGTDVQTIIDDLKSRLS
ncbi:MAG TPA: SCO family protein [Phototrophicaceae bacterium]|jgi:protein SCO1/2|nr:SCO family protein [Phototrophicaceae bacterium]